MSDNDDDEVELTSAEYIDFLEGRLNNLVEALYMREQGWFEVFICGKVTDEMRQFVMTIIRISGGVQMAFGNDPAFPPYAMFVFKEQKHAAQFMLQFK